MPSPGLGVHLDFSVRDLQGLVANFHSLDLELQAAIVQVTHEKGERCKELTQAFAPQATGFMAEHVKTAYSEAGYVFETGWDEADFLADNRRFYPPYQEFGTEKQPGGHPSLGPAYNIVSQEYGPALSRALQEAIARRGFTR